MDSVVEMLAREQMFFDVYTEFNSRLRHVGEVVLAGGSVRDFCLRTTGTPAVTKDYDIFVLDQPPFDVSFETREDSIKSALEGLPTVEPKFPWHKSEPFLVRTVLFRGAEVQILNSPCSTVDDLLDTFDWDVSRFAYNGFLHAPVPVSDIGFGKTLKLHSVTCPMSTLRRGIRFSERFGMRLEDETVRMLCEKVVRGK